MTGGGVGGPWWGEPKSEGGGVAGLVVEVGELELVVPR